MQYRYLRNEIRALFQFLQIERQKEKVPFEWKFFVHKVKIEIEARMESASTTSKNNGESKINVKKVY